MKSFTNVVNFNGCIALKILGRSFQQLTKILMGFLSYANHNTANAMVGMYLIIWQLSEAGQEHLRLIKFYQWDKYWPFHSKSASSPSTTTELTVNFRGSYRGGFQESFLKEIPLFKLKIIIISMCLKRVMGWHFHRIFPRYKIPIFLKENIQEPINRSCIYWMEWPNNQGYGHGIIRHRTFVLSL